MIKKLRRSLLICCVFVITVANTDLSFADGDAEISCAVEDMYSWKNIDLSDAVKRKVRLLDEVSEGGVAEAFFAQDRIVAIKTAFLGETGKTEIDYYIGPELDAGSYFVELFDYRYTVPIYIPGSKTASVSIHQFAICEGVKPNYPNSIDLAREYDRAVQVLESVRNSIEKLQ